MRKVADELPDELLLVLIGDMITEEALPTYLTLLNTLEGTDDPTGAVDTAWGRWSRQWTSEENRHGDLLNRYLYITGRVDMRSIEQSIMRLISSGFDPDTRSDPYRGFIYTSFQERATKISHGNVGKLAAAAGDGVLARICARIAGDEARHEKAYQLFVQEVIRIDPSGAILSYKDMMDKQIVMPAELMSEPSNPNLYNDFSRIATDLNVYTGVDYAEIMEHLNEFWKIGEVTGLTPEAEEAQEYLMKLPTRFNKLAQRQAKSLAKKPREPKEWAWINGRVI
jgi:acyl-[acyl-carrier-protein] desaturase